MLVDRINTSFFTIRGQAPLDIVPLSRDEDKGPDPQCVTPNVCKGSDPDAPEVRSKMWVEVIYMGCHLYHGSGILNYGRTRQDSCSAITM